MTIKEYLISLSVPPALEGAVVDALLVMEFERGFSGYSVFSHHHNNKNWSLAEQVTGRQKRIHFQMTVNDAELTALLLTLREDFLHSGIQYRVMPVLDSGIF